MVLADPALSDVAADLDVHLSNIEVAGPSGANTLSSLLGFGGMNDARLVFGTTCKGLPSQ